METTPRPAAAADDVDRRHRLRESGLTPRAVVLGILMAGGSALFYPYALQVNNIHGTGYGYFSLFGMFLLLVVLLVLNPTLKRINPGYALRPPEIVVMLVMTMVAVVSDVSLTTYLVATLATPRYYASAENWWADLIFPHIPDWIAPQDTGHAIEWFFNGLPPGETLPWFAWAVPLFWWGTFLAAFFLVIMALTALLRKQWVEHERLLFPLMNVPMTLIEDSDKGEIVPAIVKKPSFVAGFFFVFLLLAWNVVSWFNPTMPQMPFGGTIHVGKHFPAMYVHVAPWVVGVCYFASPEVLFSFWFFQVLARFQAAFFSRIGYGIGGADTFESSNAALGWQTWGAFAVFVLYGLWVGRRHLADVCRRAWRGRRMEHDERELMSPRLALTCLLAGLGYMVAYSARTGLSAPVIMLLVPFATIAYLGITRLVVEGGLPFIRTPITPQSFTMYTLGSTNLTAPSMVGMAFSTAWIFDMWSIFMPGMAHGAKLADWRRMNGRVIVIATAIGIAVALPLSVWFHLRLAYDTGAHNFTTWVYQGLNGVAFDYAAGKMRNPHGPDLQRLGFGGLGAVMMGALIFLRHRFAWWPLHPIGFTCPVVVGTKHIFGALFTAWLVKTVIIRFGGLLLYERGKPFFIGLVVGHLAGTALYVIIDLIFFPGDGHEIVFIG